MANVIFSSWQEELIDNRRVEEKERKIRRNTCMAGTLGRVCVRTCESNCRRANIDEPISIKYLKRFVADEEIEKKRHPVLAAGTKSGKKVAVIGAGPAGLTCAYNLVLLGHQATIFERLPEPGG